MSTVATPIDDGGPAFPAPALGQQQFDEPAVYWGMSMRDYFAAHAPAAPAEFVTPAGTSVEDGEAIWRFTYATAMVKARATWA